MSRRSRLARLEKRAGGALGRWGDRVRSLSRDNLTFYRNFVEALNGAWPREADRAASLQAVADSPDALAALRRFSTIRDVLGEPLAVSLAYDAFPDHPDVPGRMDHLQGVYSEWRTLPVLTREERALLDRIERALTAIERELGYYLEPMPDADHVMKCRHTGTRVATTEEWSTYRTLQARLARGELRRSADWLDNYGRTDGKNRELGQLSRGEPL